MLTLRFESDSPSSGPEATTVLETEMFRTERRGDMINVVIMDGRGMQMIVGQDVGCFDRLFVMNGEGKTVARFNAPLPGAMTGDANA